MGKLSAPTPASTLATYCRVLNNSCKANLATLQVAFLACHILQVSIKAIKSVGLLNHTSTLHLSGEFINCGVVVGLSRASSG